MDRWGIGQLEDAPIFNQIAEAAAAICGTPIALVSFIDRAEHCNLGSVGTDPHRFARELSICNHVVKSPRVLIVEDLREDERFAHLPSVAHPDGIRFYAGIPLMIDNRAAVGVLCVVDTKPRRLMLQERAGLMDLVRQAELHLNRHVAEQESAASDTAEAPSQDARALFERKLRLGQLMLSALAEQLGFLRGDAEYLSTHDGDRRQKSGVFRQLYQTLDELEELVESTQSLLADPSAKVANAQPVSFGQLVSDVTRAFAKRLETHGLRLSVTNRALDDRVAGQPALLHDLITRVFEVTLRSAPQDTSVDIHIDRDGDKLVWTVRSHGDWTASHETCAMIVASHDGTIETQKEGDERRRLRLRLPSVGRGSHGV
jgi:GAF domain-containing protein